jgi:hypothetical protein
MVSERLRQRGNPNCESENSNTNETSKEVKKKT